MARPVKFEKPLSDAERKRLQRQRDKSKALGCHETCHETGSSKFDAGLFLDSVGEPAWDDATRRLVAAGL